jgi:hypothetical protein
LPNADISFLASVLRPGQTPCDLCLTRAYLRVASVINSKNVPLCEGKATHTKQVAISLSCTPAKFTAALSVPSLCSILLFCFASFYLPSYTFPYRDMALNSFPVISIGNHRYLLTSTSKHPHLHKHLTEKLVRFDQEFIPTTVIDWSKTSFEPKDLESICQRFEKKDDVWSHDFLSRRSHTPALNIAQSHELSLIPSHVK